MSGDYMTFGGLHSYHESRKLEKSRPSFAALIFAAIRKADTGNLSRLENAFPELVAEMRQRYNARLGALPEDHIEDFDVLEEQIGRMME